MSLSNDRIAIGKGMNFNLIESDKFKSNLISIYIIMPLNRKEVTMNALIPLVLKRGTNNLKTKLDIERKLEELYGSNLSININKRGERHVLRFTIESPKGVFVEVRDYFIEVIKLLYEIIYNPYLVDGFFDYKYVNQEKEMLKRVIEGRINDKREYSIDRCIEEMCENEKYSIYEYGYIEDLGSIDERKLYDRYKMILETSPMEIFYVGEHNSEYIEILKEIFKNNRENILEVPREKIASISQTKNMVFEEMDVNQGKLVMGFRSNISYEDDLYNSLLLSSNILGGGPNGKLFRTVREKERLAYYINSKVYKYKSIMLIDAGIDSGNIEKTIEIIRKDIDNLKKGIFTDEDVEIAKKTITNSMNAIIDSNYLIGEYFFSKALSNDNKSLREDIEDLLKVKREDIINASNSINIDTIYFLGKREREKQEGFL